MDARRKKAQDDLDQATAALQKQCDHCEEYGLQCDRSLLGVCLVCADVGVRNQCLTDGRWRDRWAAQRKKAMQVLESFGSDFGGTVVVGNALSTRSGPPPPSATSADPPASSSTNNPEIAHVGISKQVQEDLLDDADISPTPPPVRERPPPLPPPPMGRLKRPAPPLSASPEHDGDSDPDVPLALTRQRPHKIAKQRAPLDDHDVKVVSNPPLTPQEIHLPGDPEEAGPATDGKQIPSPLAPPPAPFSVGVPDLPVLDVTQIPIPTKKEPQKRGRKPAQAAAPDRRPLPEIPSPDSRLPQTLQDRYLCLNRYIGRRKPIPSYLHSDVRVAVTRVADNFIKAPSDETLLGVLEVFKKVIVPACRAGAKKGPAILKKFVADGTMPTPELPDWENRSTLAKPEQCKRMVKKGRLGTGCRILTEESAVAPVEPWVIDELVSKHPPGSINPYGSNPGPDSGIAPYDSEVLASLDSLDPDASPGISGWNVGLLKIAVEAPRFKEFLVLLVAGIGAGTARGKSFLNTCRLTPLIKPDSGGKGIRPIAVGEIMYRLAAKCWMDKHLDDSHLLECQLGVKSRGGVEPIIHAANLALEGELDQKYTHIVSLDGVNASNRAGRGAQAAGARKWAPKFYRILKWAYDNFSDLVCGDYVIQSRTGARQGDPLGPLAFSLGLRKLIEPLITFLGPGRKLIVFLDNIYGFSVDDKALDDCIAFFQQEEWRDIMQLNPAKCKNVRIDDIQENGLEILGTCIGSADARRAFLERKINAVRQKVAHLHKLDSMQDAWLLLRKCISSDLRHLQRSLKTDDIPDAWDQLDDLLWNEVKRLRARAEIEGADGVRDDLVGRQCSTLPGRYGGLGILSHRECAPHAYAAAAEASDILVRRIFGMPAVAEYDDVRSQSARCKQVWEKRHERLAGRLDPDRLAIMVENCSPISRRWMDTVPYFGPLRLSDAAVSTGILYRTLAKPARSICRCGKDMDLGHEETCSRIQHTGRHNAIRDFVIGTLKAAPSVTVTPEPPSLSGKRRNDIRLSGGRRGQQDVDYDVKVYSMGNQKGTRTLSKPYERDALVLKECSIRIESWLLAIEAAATQKAPEIHGMFKPLVISTGGVLSPNTAKEFESWKREVGMSRIGWLKERISIHLITDRSRQLQRCFLLSDGKGEEDARETV